MKLDKNKIYDLSELTSEELEELWIYLTKVDEDWACCPFEEMIRYQKKYRLVSNTYSWYWSDIIGSTANAKELFYTLENVQVDCREVQPIHIHNMANVVVNQLDPTNKSFDLRSDCTYFSFNKHCNLFGFYKYDKQQYEITYEKFMELFGKEEVKLNLESNPFSGNLLCKELKKYWNKEKSKEFNNLVEVLNEELTKEAEYEVKYIAEKPKEHIEHNLEMTGKPIQYQIGIDAIGIAEKNMTIDECLAIARFNITKYSYRKKNQDLEDFKKVIAYANWAISLLNKA